MVTVDEVCDFLRSKGVSDAVLDNFKDNKVDGNAVILLSIEQLRQLGLTAIGDIVTLKDFCEKPATRNETRSSDMPHTVSGFPKKKRTKLLKCLLESSTSEFGIGGFGNSVPEKLSRPGRPKVNVRKVTFGLRKSTSSGRKSYQQIKCPLGDSNVLTVSMNTNITYNELHSIMAESMFPDGENPVVGSRCLYETEIVNTANNNVNTDLPVFTLDNYITKKMLTGVIRMHVLCTSQEIDLDFSSELPDISNDLCLPAAPVHTHASREEPVHTYTNVTNSGEVAFRCSTPVNHEAQIPDSLSGNISSISPVTYISNIPLAYSIPYSMPSISYTHLLEAPVISVATSEAPQMNSTDVAVSLNSTASQDYEILDTSDLSAGPPNLNSVLCKLAMPVQDDECGRNIVNIVRSSVLDGGFRAFKRSLFTPTKKLDVTFIGEDGIDGGGLQREFMRLATIAIKELPIFHGAQNSRLLQLDYACIQANTYYLVGKMLAYFVVHRGPCIQFLSPTLFASIADLPMEPSIDDLPDKDMQDSFQQIESATTAEEFHDIIVKVTDLIDVAGCLSLASNFEKKEMLMKALLRFYVIDRMKHALVQFQDGLKTLGVLDEIREHSDLMIEVFVDMPNSKSLTADNLSALFDIIFSEVGSNRRMDEERCVGYWLDFIQDIQDGDDEVVSLQDLLIFITGASSVPPLGFSPQPRITFLHPADLEPERAYMTGLPRVNTCALEFQLPIVGNFDLFKERMIAAVSMLTTFTTA